MNRENILSLDNYILDANWAVKPLFCIFGLGQRQIIRECFNTIKLAPHNAKADTSMSIALAPILLHDDMKSFKWNFF